MPCYHPIRANLITYLSGKKKISFGDGYVPDFVESMDAVNLPCGKCIGCLSKRSNDWMIRCYHEAQVHHTNCFLTLTYNDKNLPKDGSLVPRDVKLFLMRLRKRVGRFRYFLAGEYGAKLGRPHYHIILFGWSPSDLRVHSCNRYGDCLYVSQVISELWTKGFHTVGQVTLKSIQYTAKYVMKRVYSNDEHYNGKYPEFNRVSLKPGLGATWFQKYSASVFPLDRCLLDKALEYSAPRYYLKLLQKLDESMYNDVMERRKLHAIEMQDVCSDIDYLKYLEDGHIYKWESAQALRKEDSTFWKGPKIVDVPISNPNVIYLRKEKYEAKDVLSI
ncbi:MAG: replication initiator protein [Arizlama microvirus]|nr:MAG: replication initiator protein [Arizlama microvirus]